MPECRPCAEFARVVVPGVGEMCTDDPFTASRVSDLESRNPNQAFAAYAYDNRTVGFVQEPGSEEGYVIAVMSNWWSTWERRVPVVEEISRWVSSELAR